VLFASTASACNRFLTQVGVKYAMGKLSPGVGVIAPKKVALDSTGLSAPRAPETPQQPQAIRAAAFPDHPTQSARHDLFGRYPESATTKKNPYSLSMLELAA